MWKFVVRYVKGMLRKHHVCFRRIQVGFDHVFEILRKTRILSQHALARFLRLTTFRARFLWRRICDESEVHWEMWKFAVRYVKGELRKYYVCPRCVQIGLLLLFTRTRKARVVSVRVLSRCLRKFYVSFGLLSIRECVVLAEFRKSGIGNFGL